MLVGVFPPTASASQRSLLVAPPSLFQTRVNFSLDGFAEVQHGQSGHASRTMGHYTHISNALPKCYGSWDSTACKAL
eukprot:2746024-Amphidinium_carterae.1